MRTLLAPAGITNTSILDALVDIRVTGTLDVVSEGHWKRFAP